MFIQIAVIAGCLAISLDSLPTSAYSTRKGDISVVAQAQQALPTQEVKLFIAVRIVRDGRALTGFLNLTNTNEEEVLLNLGNHDQSIPLPTDVRIYLKNGRSLSGRLRKVDPYQQALFIYNQNSDALIKLEEISSVEFRTTDFYSPPSNSPLPIIIQIEPPDDEATPGGSL